MPCFTCPDIWCASPTRSAADAAADAAAEHGHAAEPDDDEQRHPPCAARVRTAAYGIRQPGGIRPWRQPRWKDEEDEEGLPRWKEAQGIQDQALLKAVLD